MEVLLNDKSIAMQFTEDTFMEYIKNEVLPIMKLLNDNNVTFLKEYSTYACLITSDKTVYDFITCKGNPIIDRFKDHLVQLTSVAPFWNDNPKTKTNVQYECAIEDIPNCITETYERSGMLFSLINGGYDDSYIELKCNEEKNGIRNFCKLIELKNHFAEIGYITLWNSNSFNVDSIGYKFEIRFREDNHNMPHFHLSNANESASISIPDADIIAGGLQKSQKAISWSIRNMENIVELWNQYHPEKIVVYN